MAQNKKNAEKNIKDLIREKDSFLTTSEKIYEYAAAHAKPIIVGIAVAAVLVIGLALYQNYRDSQAEAAMTAYNEAWRLRAEGSSPEAISALEKIKEDFSGSQAARLADFALVKLYTNDRQYRKALTLSESLIKTMTVNEEVLKPALLNNLAGLYEAEGENEPAASTYQAVLDTGDQELALDTMLSLARVKTNLGRPEEAVTLYEQILTGFSPTLPQVYVARLKLAELRGERPDLSAAPENLETFESPQTSETATQAADPLNRSQDDSVQESDL